MELIIMILKAWLYMLPLGTVAVIYAICNIRADRKEQEAGK